MIVHDEFSKSPLRLQRSAGFLVDWEIFDGDGDCDWQVPVFCPHLDPVVDKSRGRLKTGVLWCRVYC